MTFSAEPPERRQARTQKFLPLYGVSVVLGLVETAAVWAVGLAGTEGAMMLLIINVIFGIVYASYVRRHRAAHAEADDENASISGEETE